MLIQTYSSVPSVLPYGGQVSPRDDRGDRMELKFRVSTQDVPALAETLVQLELLLRSQTVDLAAVTDLVRSDLGLSMQALRQTRSEPVGGDGLWRISDCVVDRGARLLEHARPLCYWAECKQAYAEAEAFWKHSRLVATVAERTAAYFTELGVDPEQAYLGGLMHNLERLPDVLELAYGPTIDGSVCTIREWVEECNLPSFIYEVLQSAREAQETSEMSPLQRVVEFARRWMELSLPWSETCIARRSRFKQPVLQTVNLIYAFFPNTDADPLLPFMDVLKECTLGLLAEQRADSSSVTQRNRLLFDTKAPLIS
jgi:hypothetical protein